MYRQNELENGWPRGGAEANGDGSHVEFDPTSQRAAEKLQNFVWFLFNYFLLDEIFPILNVFFVDSSISIL